MQDARPQQDFELPREYWDAWLLHRAQQYALDAQDPRPAEETAEAYKATNPWEVAA